MTNKFKDKLDNTPHLMTEQAFVNFVEFLKSNPTPEYLASLVTEDSSSELANYNPDTKIGVIPIQGSLEYRTEWYHRYGYGTSYEMILDQAEAFAEAGAKTFLLDVSSGGGEAYSMMETGDTLRKIADAKGIKIIAYVDGYSASAAYGITSQADEIIANPMSEVGSVGVVVRLRNVNKAMQEAGVEDTYIYAGKNKIPYKADGSWRKEFVDDIQAKVDALYEEFTNHVAANREMSVEAIKSTEAATYLAKDALELGLIDSVMTHEEFSTYLADYVQKKQETPMFNMKKLKLNSEQEKVEMQELDQAKAELSDLQVKLTSELEAKSALEGTVATLEASLTELKTKLSVFEEAQAKLEADKEALEKAQADAKLAERKAKLTDVLPADKVEEVLATLADTSEAVFSLAIAGYESAKAQTLASASFNEIGGEGEAVDHGKPDPVKAHIEWQKKNKPHLNK